ncbi:hypothetical protein DERF_014403 [Dermatophagoides farinae]|uniref:Uncharacterized protein n=1 Tax=Dermatophagoides farinae TaxID=6954 RepID=A0A922HM73_DERFA|nr:hypothetical protein DERF_014403 [Dermatophagoides farinae]
MTIVANIVLADNKSFIVRGNNVTEWQSIRYAYKSPYGLSNRLKCDGSIHQQFNECERTAHHTWQVTIDDYFYQSKKFCCFIWQTLDCERDVAAKCSVDYAKKLEANTEQSYKSMCDGVGSARDSWTCWFTEERTDTILWIIGIVLLILTTICACLGIRLYNSNKTKPEMEIQKIGKSTDINKQMHLSIANYAANLRQVSASDAPIKQPQTRGNRSFLLPDGGGSITDPPLPSGVPKNIPSSASRTPTPVMRPERATTPVMKPKGASVPKNIASSASKAPTPVMKPEGASVPKNIPSSASKAPTPVMKPEGASVPKNIHSSASKAPTPVMKPEGASVTKNIPSSASKAPIPVMKPEGASVPKNIHSSASKAPIPVMQPEGTSVPKNIPSASNAPIPVMQPEGTNVPKNIPSASKAPIQVMQPEGTSVPKNIPSSASSETAAILENVSPSSSVHRGGYSSATLTPASSRNSFGSDITQVLSQPTNSKIQRHSSLPDLKSTQPATIERLSKSLISVHDQQSPLSSASSTSSYLSASDGYATDSSGLVMIAGSKKPKFQANTSSSSVLGRQIDTPSLQQTSPPPPSPTAPVGNVLEQIPQMDAHTPREFVLQPPIRLDRTQSQIITGSRQTLLPKSASSPSIFYPEMDAPSPTTPVGNVLDRTQSEIITGSRQAILQKSTSSPSIFYPEMDAPSSSTSTTPSPATSVDNILDQIPQMDAHTTRKYVLQPPIRLDRTQSEIITGSRETILPKSTSSPSIFYPELEAPSSSTSTPSPTPSVDNVSVSSSRPLSPALSETSDIHPSIGSNNALATTEPVNSSIDVIKDVNISRGPSFKSAKKTIEKKFAYEPRSTVVTNLDSFETRRQSIAEKMTTIVRHLFSFSGTSSYTRPVSRSTTAISPQPSPSPSSSSISTSSSSTSTPSSSTSIPDMTATTDMTRVIQELDALSKLRNLDSTP